MTFSNHPGILLGPLKGPYEALQAVEPLKGPFQGICKDHIGLPVLLYTYVFFCKKLGLVQEFVIIDIKF